MAELTEKQISILEKMKDICDKIGHPFPYDLSSHDFTVRQKELLSLLSNVSGGIDLLFDLYKRLDDKALAAITLNLLAFTVNEFLDQYFDQGVPIQYFHHIEN